MSSSLRIGVIGVGTMGYAHAHYLAGGNVENAVLSALCDHNPARLEELKSLFPGIPLFSCTEDLLSAGKCDAVIIATPHYDHPIIGIKAFQNGLHVLSEKPLAVQLSAAEAFVQAADQSGKTFCIMLNQRTDPLYIKARQLIQGGVMGMPKRFHWIITNWYRTQKYYDSGSWRATWLGEGGGVLLNQAPHNLDIWQWLFGMPERIRAFCTKGKYHHIEVEDEALIYGEYANGATAVFQTSTGEYPGTNRLEITGDRGKMVLENGVLKLWRLKEAERTFCFEAQEPFAKIPMEYEEMSFSSKGSAHGRIIQNFVNHILFEEPLISDGREGVRELTLSNCAYLSSWEDRWVTLPPENALFDRHLQALCKNSRLNQDNEAPQNAPYQERWRVRW